MLRKHRGLDISREFPYLQHSFFDEINENKVKECNRLNKENKKIEIESKLELNEIN